MRFLDLTLRTPAENLACDEALLDRCEGHGDDEILRVWESTETFVVVGYANRISKEVNLAACEASHVPVYRRCSGGGTVVQGPGCLNYTVILRIEEDGPSQTISSANRFVMEQNAAALEAIRPAPSAIQKSRSPIKVEGHTDLAVDGRKFSGNSQRRRKRFLLFHGTFLLNFDLALIGQFLPQPSRQPDYRRDRSHHDFIMNLELSAASVKQALRRAWQADELLAGVPNETIASLVRDKYATTKWNLKF